MAAEKPAPVRVLYCGVCGLPAEYCEFGPDFQRCKPWLRAHAPGVYPDDLVAGPSSSGGAGGDRDVDKVGERLQGVGISDGSSSAAGDASASKPEEVKRLPGGKLKKKTVFFICGTMNFVSDIVPFQLQEKQEVVIEKIVRNKRKCVTVVKGLELFGVKLSDASKKLGKKFATGASVVKGPTEKEQIDVQGDISYDIVEFITDTWPDVPESAIFFIEDGRKVPAA
ncbi:Translation initiation factor SUI1 family protein [Zea mays]|uniref:Translation machinery-associated protein 22 n=1 Tax=Zea mays TaxID=4577 RepID=A0A1D6MHI1_MAIZE|nr:Translation initiation factor SUI1 family protein [Zea mays]